MHTQAVNHVKAKRGLFQNIMSAEWLLMHVKWIIKRLIDPCYRNKSHSPKPDWIKRH